MGYTKTRKYGIAVPDWDWTFRGFGATPQETAEWENAIRANNVFKFRAFLVKYPNSEYSGQAQQGIDNLISRGQTRMTNLQEQALVANKGLFPNDDLVQKGIVLDRYNLINKSPAYSTATQTGYPFEDFGNMFKMIAIAAVVGIGIVFGYKLLKKKGIV